MEFYQKLRSIRKENGMSQEDLADHLGVSRQAVSKWESGQGFPETDKLLQMSTLFHVSLDYLLKEEQGDAGSEEPGYYASREMVEGFLLARRQGAFRIGVGVALIIVSLVFVFLFEDNIGVVLFLLGVSVGVSMLVAHGFWSKSYKELETQPLLFDAAFIKEFRNAHVGRRKRYGLQVVLGIFIIILSFAAMLLLEEISGAFGEQSMAFLPPLWALAVFLFISAGSAMSAEAIIANNAEHIKEQEAENKSSWIWGVVMPLTAMGYLALGFLWNAWHPGWLVFPIAALICTGITGWHNSR